MPKKYASIPQFRPFNKEQELAKRLCDTSTVSILTGPAGTAKTFCAVASAVDAFVAEEIQRIFITRPAVEACGESLGYLPGDVTDKLNPYMNPVYDAVEKYCHGSHLEEEIKKSLRVVPLAYMRGRTFDRSVCIMDEAQNATEDQIKMFLTRIGYKSRMILAGDTDQSDIRNCRLTNLAQRLSSEKDVSWHRFGASSIVRHPIIGRLLRHFPELKKSNSNEVVIDSVLAIGEDYRIKLRRQDPGFPP